MGLSKRSTPSNVEISGFWTRKQGETLCGVLIKYVANNKDPKHVRPFFIFEVKNPENGKQTDATISVGRDEPPKKGKKAEREEREAVVGEFVGVAANYALASTIDYTKDTGKLCRMTVSGTATNPNGPVPMILIDVEVEDDETTSS